MIKDVLTILYVEDDFLIAAAGLAEIEEYYGDRIRMLHAVDFQGGDAILSARTDLDGTLSDGRYPGKTGEMETGGADLYSRAVDVGMQNTFALLTGNARETIDLLEKRGLPAIPANRIFQKPASLVEVIEQMLGLSPSDRPNPSGQATLTVLRPA